MSDEVREQSIPVGSVMNWEALSSMTEDEARDHLDAALENLSFGDRAELLRRLGNPPTC